MAKLPFITPSTIPTATISRCLVFPDSLEWRAIINGFIAMGTDIRNWQQLEGGVTPQEAVEACVSILYNYFENNPCGEVNALIVGEMRFFFFDTPPTKWLVCDGSAIDRTTYAELFAAIGTTYGAGNETTTFNLPDMSGRSPVATGQPYTGADTIGLAATFGEQKHTQTVAEMPSHDHQQTVNQTTPANRFVAGGSGVTTFAGSSSSSTTPLTTQTRGSGTAFNVMNPGMGLLCCIYTGVE